MVKGQFEVKMPIWGQRSISRVCQMIFDMNLIVSNLYQKYVKSCNDFDTTSKVCQILLVKKHWFTMSNLCIAISI
jgi:hypothetical protein